MAILILLRQLSVLLVLGISLHLPLQAQQTFYTFAEQTNVRQEASLESNKIDQLIAGEEVYSLAERSTNITNIVFNGQSLRGAWQKVVTQSGKQGWIHEALLLDKAPLTEYYTWVEYLRLRKEPTLTAEVLETLPFHEVLRFLGERSLHKDRIKLRNQDEAFFWMKMSTPSGKIGWVYGGGIKLSNSGKNPPLNTIQPNSVEVPVVDFPIVDIPTTDAHVAETLRIWWQSLKPEWKTFFNERVLKKDILDLYKMPTVAELQKIRALKELDLSNNDECNTGPFYAVPLNDLSGLEELSALEKLYCEYIHFDNLVPLSKLNKLHTLSIHKSKFNSLEGLEKLQNLTWLYLGFMEQGTSDLAILKGLGQLTELYIEAEKISDLNPLRSLLKLRKLIIKCPDIKSLQGIDALFNLEHLAIVAEQSTLDLRPLESLKRMDYCLITAFEADYQEVFSKCTALSYLIFSSIENRFDLAIIANLPHLRELELRCPELLNGQALSKINSLQALYLSYIESFDFNHIQACSNLWALEVDAQRVLNLQVLSSLTKLSRLGILSDGVVSLKEIPTLPALQLLRIKSYNLTTLEGIERFPKSYSLDFSECQKLLTIQQIQALKELIELYIPPHISFNDSRVQEIKRQSLEIRNRPLGGC